MSLADVQSDFFSSECRDDSALNAFRRQVNDALAHLHDLAYLQTHPLVRFLREPDARKPLLGAGTFPGAYNPQATIDPSDLRARP